MLSKLEKGGFIEQKTNPDNMREHNIYLTKKGFANLQQAHCIRQKNLPLTT